MNTPRKKITSLRARGGLIPDPLAMMLTPMPCHLSAQINIYAGRWV